MKIVLEVVCKHVDKFGLFNTKFYVALLLLALGIIGNRQWYGFIPLKGSNFIPL